MTRNLGLKSLAAIIAILIWWFVNGESNITVRTITVPVDYRDRPIDKIIVSDLNRQIRVTLRGPAFLVNRVEASQPVFKVSIPAVTDNRFTATFNKYDLGVSAPVDVVDIDPPSVEVLFDKSISRELEVNVPRVGGISEAIRLDSFQVSPEKVMVLGTETELRGAKKIDTEPFDLRELSLDNAGKPLAKRLHLKAPGKYTTIQGGDQVDVQIVVSAVELQKTFNNLPVEVRAISGGEVVHISPSKVNVEVMGHKKAVEVLNKDELLPFVRLLPGMAPAQSLKVQVELPRGISVLRVDPPEVSLVPSPTPTPTAIPKGGGKKLH